jgi:hypothetical protein
MSDITLWNTVLSLVIGLLSWILKEKSSELSRVTLLLNTTREEVAKTYITKAEVHADINRVLSRLEILDAKLDRLVERRNSDRKQT